MRVYGNYNNLMTSNYKKVNNQKFPNKDHDNPLKENKHYFGNISLRWSDGAIYANGTPEGNSFSIYKSEDYSVAEPMMYVKGVDTEGNYYEQKINAKEVNPRNASYTEIMALNAYLVEQGQLRTESIGFVPRDNNDMDKKDYMSILQEWRDMQKSVGNLVEYKNLSDVCNAFLEFCK